MEIYLPCKIGEKFTERKFKEWEKDKRVYADGAERTLKGFNAQVFVTKSLAIPTIVTNDNFLEYDVTGEFLQQFTPKYKIIVDVNTKYKLSDRGFPSEKTGILFGIIKQGENLLADFIAGDRYEHIYYTIKDNIKYADSTQQGEQTIIEYDPLADKNRKTQPTEQREIKQNKKKSIKDLIKSKIRKTEVADDSSN